jgi:hypothetical protein
MQYFVALLIFIGVYVLADFLLGMVKPVAKIASVMAVLIGILCALLYVGAL